LRRFLDEAIEDAGGDDISSGKKRTLEIAQMARGCAMLVLKDIKEKGLSSLRLMAGTCIQGYSN